jgi:hypothetical protein
MEVKAERVVERVVDAKVEEAKMAEKGVMEESEEVGVDF